MPQMDGKIEDDLTLKKKGSGSILGTWNFRILFTADELGVTKWRGLVREVRALKGTVAPYLEVWIDGYG
jgi:hypothetical protein